MPISKRPAPKRRFKKKRTPNFVQYKVAKWPRPTAGLPDSTVAKLRYCDTLTLTSLVGALATQVYRMNSIFDPDSTGAGHQPLYHDAWAALYGRYVVTSSHLKCTFNAIDTAAGSDWNIGLISDDNGAISAATNTNNELSNGINDVLTPSGGSRDQVILRSVWYSPKARFQLPPTDESVGADFGANPVNTWFTTIWGANFAATATSSVRITVVIDYFVTMSRMLTPVGS